MMIIYLILTGLKICFDKKNYKANLVETNSDVFDAIGYTNYKSLWHRGFPLELIKNRKYKKKKLIISNLIFKLHFGMVILI